MAKLTYSYFLPRFIIATISEQTEYWQTLPRFHTTVTGNQLSENGQTTDHYYFSMRRVQLTKSIPCRTLASPFSSLEPVLPWQWLNLPAPAPHLRQPEQAPDNQSPVMAYGLWQLQPMGQ